MKKNKDIEVQIDEKQAERQGQSATVHQLSVGKKEIGEVALLADGKFYCSIEEERAQKVKSFEEGYELIIRHWNLFQ